MAQDAAGRNHGAVRLPCHRRNPRRAAPHVRVRDHHTPGRQAHSRAARRHRRIQPRQRNARPQARRHAADFHQCPRGGSHGLQRPRARLPLRSALRRDGRRHLRDSLRPRHQRRERQELHLRQPQPQAPRLYEGGATESRSRCSGCRRWRRCGCANSASASSTRPRT